MEWSKISFSTYTYICQCFRLLDTPPSLMKSAIVKAPPLEGKGFSQYEAVFLQLADEHRTVNAFELQELLEACLPNGMACFFYCKIYKKSYHVKCIKILRDVNLNKCFFLISRLHQKLCLHGSLPTSSAHYGRILSIQILFLKIYFLILFHRIFEVYQ